MGRSQRTKGQSGEREIAAILRDVTGWEIRRRVRQHDGDTDLEGVPGWAVEVKRHKTAKPGEVAAWWAQAVSQAKDGIPVLFYRADGQRAWSAVAPLAVILKMQKAEMWGDEMKWAATLSVEGWAAVAREVASDAVA